MSNLDSIDDYSDSGEEYGPDIETESDWESEPESDSDYEDNKINEIIEITTDGITDQQLSNLCSEEKKNIKKCGFCFKNYKINMIVDVDTDEIMCWHCLFWLNYAPDVRKQVDGNLGMTIAEYILQCHEYHNVDNCTKKTDQGGCFLCEYKSGYVFSDIDELWKIYDLNKINSDQSDLLIVIKDEIDVFSDIEDEEIMTVYI